MAKEKANPAWMLETDFDGAAYDYKRNRKEGEPSLDEAIKKINESSSSEDREKALNKAMEVTNRRVKGLKKKFLPGKAAESQMDDVVGV
jgi:vacuolar-type H+-ATPase subunit D/Vma8